MEFWKDLINLKESKKPSDKFLRVWAKNQLGFEIFEKILKFTFKNLNGKFMLYPFSLPFSRSLAECWIGRGSSRVGRGVGSCTNPWFWYRNNIQIQSSHKISILYEVETFQFNKGYNGNLPKGLLENIGKIYFCLKS